MGMDWACVFLGSSNHNTTSSVHSNTNWTENITELNTSASTEMDDTLLQNAERKLLADDVPQWGFILVATKIIIPGLCVFGVTGNLLNLLVIVFRFKEGVDYMEKGALIGMSALALSDFLFCLITLCDTYLLEDSMIYREKNASFFFTVYGSYFQSTLIKTSTWFTMIMAISRYLAVCYPLKARQQMRPSHMTIAIILSSLFWIGFHLPLLWTLKVIPIGCKGEIIYLLSIGAFMERVRMRKYLMYLWATLGFFVPVFVLACCNLELIRSLRVSRHLRNQSRGYVTRQRDFQHRTNITLIAIVAMFFFCVCPSEIVHFYTYVAFGGNADFPYSTLLVISNLLQVVNFSSNFALYCVVNTYFRKVLWKLIPCSWDRENSKIQLNLSGWQRNRNAVPRTTFVELTSYKRNSNYSARE